LLSRLFGSRPAAVLLERYIDRRWLGARTSAIARTRLIDEWIIEATVAIDQLVLLGAGFDTRAWRLPALAGKHIFEVDHPNTSAMKQTRLLSAGADLQRARFVALDFEQGDLPVALRKAGFDAERPAIVVWEGVSQYLPFEAVDGVMRWAGHLAPRSVFIFTYVHEGVLDGSTVFLGADKAIAKVQKSGEPWQFGLIPERLGAFLGGYGLSLIEDLGADDYRARVWGPRARAMGGYAFYHAVLTEVPRA
jgi:methyltransferase (TIGR00027 family)